MARSITEQTGWKRIYPQMICQDTDVLASVCEYSYDIENIDFVKYFTGRTGVVLDDQHPELLSRKERGLLRTPATPFDLMKKFCVMTDDEYMSTDLLVYVFGDNAGVVIPHDARNLRTHRILRGKLQDCWELFSKAA